MVEERDLTHDPISGEGAHAADEARQDSGQEQRAAGPLPVARAVDYPAGESEYWRESFMHEPFYEAGRSFEEYAPAFELGWVSHGAYGGDFDAADRVMANDWDVRKGVSTLAWYQVRPAARASWRRAENTRLFATDGSAGSQQAIDALNDLLENARDGELGFREAAEHTKTPGLSALFGRRADTCRQAAAELSEQIERLGGKVDAGGTVSGAAHRVWVHIRGLFGGASDETMLDECERGEDAALARYRKALSQNLPPDLHAMVLRQFEGAQRNHDMIKAHRDRARAEAQARTDG